MDQQPERGACLRLADLARAIGADVGSADPETWVRGVSTDTRTLRPGQAYFALRGEHFDGARFVQRAFAAGASAVVVADDAQLDAGDEAAGALLRVPDATRALGELACWWRQRAGFTVVAITGSAGKTTTKDMLYAMLRRERRAVRAVKSFNNDVGVPLTILSASVGTEVVVLEVGTNAPGEIAGLGAIARPDLVILTCIAPAHLEGLGSVEGVEREKLSLLDYLRPRGAVILNEDDPRLAAAAERLRRVSGTERVIGCSLGPAASATDACAWRARVRPGEPWRVATYHGGRAGPVLQPPVPGRPAALSAVLALAAADRLGVAPRLAARGLAGASATPGRMNVIRAGGVTILDDTYNANPASVRAALETLAALAPEPERVVVLGDMLELGQRSAELHHAVGAAAATQGVARLVCVGPQAAAAAAGARAAGMSSDQVRQVEHAGQVLDALGDLPSHCTVLVKGSRGCRLERAVDALRRALAPTHSSHLASARLHSVA
jgi:UDP-N-acetylmuramoyl-tripeptide--D-alanyl-D-alanine ligase